MIHAALSLRTGGSRPAGSMILLNRSDETIVVWTGANSWSDQALTLELVDQNGNALTSLRREGQVYTRNVPATKNIAPGDQFEIPFDTADGTWELSEPWDETVSGSTDVRAVYDSGQSPEAEEHGVWREPIRTSFVSLGEG